jgi:ubiquitin fusion degradation protein 1
MWQHTYKCIEKNTNISDKIILPISAFEELIKIEIEYPMLFQLTFNNKTTHCGVLEFTAPEGSVLIPKWMMNNLELKNDSIINIKNISLPKATYVKFKILTSDFWKHNNFRSILENTLSKYTCLTKNDIISINYENNDYQFQIIELQPNDAVSIVETDCEVDFEEQQKVLSSQSRIGNKYSSNIRGLTTPFYGKGNKL